MTFTFTQLAEALLPGPNLAHDELNALYTENEDGCIGLGPTHNIQRVMSETVSAATV